MKSATQVEEERRAETGLKQVKADEIESSRFLEMSSVCKVSEQ